MAGVIPHAALYVPGLLVNLIQRIVRDAVLVPVIKSSAAQSLTAFVTLAARNETSDFQLARNLRRQLNERLPRYMLPRKFGFLEAFPMKAYGKVDRAALARSL